MKKPEWKKEVRKFLKETAMDVNNTLQSIKTLLQGFQDPNAFISALSGLHPETDAGEVIIENIIENLTELYDLDLEVHFEDYDEDEEDEEVEY